MIIIYRFFDNKCSITIWANSSFFTVIYIKLCPTLRTYRWYNWHIFSSIRSLILILFPIISYECSNFFPFFSLLKDRQTDSSSIWRPFLFTTHFYVSSLLFNSVLFHQLFLKFRILRCLKKFCRTIVFDQCCIQMIDSLTSLLNTLLNTLLDTFLKPNRLYLI